MQAGYKLLDTVEGLDGNARNPDGMARRPDGWNSGQMGVRTGWLDRPDG
jgi:hypothetical protein